MDMDVFELDGRINEAGELEVKLPEGVRPGEVKVQIRVAQKEAEEIPWEERPWTQEEIQALFVSQPVKTGAEIVQLLEQTSDWWKQQEIDDPVQWLEAQRRAEEEKRQW
jgi:CxxC motif-containing protein